MNQLIYKGDTPLTKENYSIHNSEIRRAYIKSNLTSKVSSPLNEGKRFLSKIKDAFMSNTDNEIVSLKGGVPIVDFPGGKRGSLYKRGKN